MTTVAEVMLWGTRIGIVSLLDNEHVAAFEYDSDFLNSRIEVSPLSMPLSDQVYRFPELAQNTFHGLPGLLADSLPDRFGQTLINAWLASQGRRADSFNAIERLCYTGSRGMGALEFKPATEIANSETNPIQVNELVKLASQILMHRSELAIEFSPEKTDATKARALAEILQVGTSAGGARAKAVIAWHPITNEIRSGQIQAGEGFEYWLLKFDGVKGNKDKELDDPAGYGAIEYAYYMMARDAGVTISDCQLLEENGRRHFMTRRFDRITGGDKLHMQSLCALAHYDYNDPSAYSYEQAFIAIKQLGLTAIENEEMFRRMVFNLVMRNQDDHVKNIAFLMDRRGQWSLAPAFDITYSYNPSGDWTHQHQMSVNGKRDGFDLDDLKAAGRVAGLKQGKVKSILSDIVDVAKKWPQYANKAEVFPQHEVSIKSALRINW